MILEYNRICDSTGWDSDGLDRGKSLHIYINENQDNLMCKLILKSKDQKWDRFDLKCYGDFNSENDSSNDELTDYEN